MHPHRSVVAPLAGVVRHSLVLALSCLSLGATRGAFAQGSNAVAEVRGIASPTTDCAGAKHEDVAVPVGAASVACAQGLATYRASASNFDGVTRAASSAVSGSDPASGPFHAATVSATARWEDMLSFTGVVPASAVLRLAWDGALFAHVEAGITAWAAAGASAYFRAQSLGAGVGSEQSRQTTLSVFGTASPTTRSASVSEALELLIPVVGSVPTPGINFYWVLGTSAGIRHDYPFGSPAASASSDFSHTAALSGLAFLDAAGSDITASVAYTFRNGTRIVPTAVVPEPGTWALLATGLLGLGAITRRRRPRR